MEQVMALPETATFNPTSKYYTMAADGSKVYQIVESQKQLNKLNATDDVFEETAAPTPTGRNRSQAPVPRNSISKADAKALSDRNLENSLALPSAVSDLPIGTTVMGKCLGFTEKLSRRTQQLFPATKVEVNGAKFLILFDDRLEEGAEFTAIIEDAGEATRSGKTLTVK